MTPSSALPSEADPAAVVADFERRARRFETDGGAGPVVWRTWGEGPPLILAHGSHGAWSHFIRNIDVLAAEHTVWAPDLPGCGESALASHEDQAVIAGALAEGMRDLIGPDVAVDVVGFSFGGVACAHLAAYHPELVRRLILVGSGGLDTPVGQVPLKRLRGLDGEARREVMRENLLSLMLRDPASVDPLALYLNELNGPRGRLNPASIVLPDKLVNILAEVSAQVDAIWGEFDAPHPDPALQESVLRKRDPDIDFRVIAGAGHWVMYERAEAFNSTVVEMLRRPLRKPRG